MCALKQLYKFSICILKFQGELSDSFRMERGVRQGAASSVLLFNTFMDGLFEHFNRKCSVEDVLNDIHTLIHAKQYNNSEFEQRQVYTKM